MLMLMEIGWVRLGHGMWGRWLIPELDLTLMVHIGGNVPNLRLLINLLRLRWHLLLLLVVLLRSIARLLNEYWTWLHHRLLLCTHARVSILANVLWGHQLVSVGVRYRLLILGGIHFIIL